MIVDGAVFFGEVTGGATLFSQDTFTIAKTAPSRLIRTIWRTVQANRAPAATRGPAKPWPGGTVTLTAAARLIRTVMIHLCLVRGAPG